MHPLIAEWTTSDKLTALNASLTFLYCVLTGLIVVVAVRQVEALTRPHLYFGLEFRGNLVEAVLKNTGKSPALNVELSIDPPLRTDINGKSGPAVLWTAKGYTIPPESESREYLGSWQTGCGILTYKVKLIYRSPKGKKYEEEMKVSFEHNRERAFVSRPSSEDSLAKIADAMVKIASKQ